MSGMAEEIARRMDEAGATAGEQPAGGVPGTGEGAAQPAGALNTDSTASGPPETIPYARFKEVNDRLKAVEGFERLAGFGYAPDSLERLAAFEAAYQSDPVGTWRTMATNLDLPPEVMSAIDTHLLSATTNGAAEGAPSGAGQPASGLSDADRARLDRLEQAEAERDAAAVNARLDAIIAAWDDMDKEDGITTPRITQLAYIQSEAGLNRGHGNVQDFVRAARAPRLELRDGDLGSVIQRPGGGALAPSPLPGSPPSAAPPVKFGSLREASKAAEADIQAGRLPPILR